MAFNKRGEAVRSARLTERGVLEMRRLYASGEWSLRALGARFDCSPSAAYRVVTGESWAHLPLEARPSREASQRVRSRAHWEARRVRQLGMR